MADEKPEAKPIYKYKVIERTFKEHKLMAEGAEYVTSLLQVSRALEPADEFTAKAVEKLRAEHEADKAAKTSPEGKKVADLEAQIAELKALVEKLAEGKRK